MKLLRKHVLSKHVQSRRKVSMTAIIEVQGLTKS